MKIYDRNKNKIDKTLLRNKFKNVNRGGFGILIPCGVDSYKIPDYCIENHTTGNFCKSYVLNTTYKLRDYDYDHIILAHRIGNNSKREDKKYKDNFDLFLEVFNSGMKKMVKDYDPVEIVESSRTCTYPLFLLKVPYSVYRKPFLIDTISACIRILGQIDPPNTEEGLKSKLKDNNDLSSSKLNKLFEGDIEYRRLPDVSDYHSQGDIHAKGGHLNGTPILSKSIKRKFYPGEKVKLKSLKVGDKVEIVQDHMDLSEAMLGTPVIGKKAKVVGTMEFPHGIPIDLGENLGCTHRAGDRLSSRTGFFIPRSKLNKVS